MRGAALRLAFVLAVIVASDSTRAETIEVPAPTPSDTPTSTNSPVFGILSVPSSTPRVSRRAPVTPATAQPPTPTPTAKKTVNGEPSLGPTATFPSPTTSSTDEEGDPRSDNTTKPPSTTPKPSASPKTMEGKSTPTPTSSSVEPTPTTPSEPDNTEEKTTPAPPAPTPTATPLPTIPFARPSGNAPAHTPSGSSDDDQGPIIIGGKESRTASNTASQYQGSGKTAPTYRALQYTLGAIAAVSLILLLAAHSVAVDQHFDWTSMACAPNTWEFVLYASYVQHLMSLGQLVLINTPGSLWTVVDGFSWTVFLPYHSDTSAVGRRLSVILLSGVVAFADRVGVSESDLLVRTVTGLAVFAGGFLVLFFGVAAVTKRKIDNHENFPSQRNPLDVRRILFWRNVSLRVSGVLILLWVFSLYPLCTTATYEMSMEIRANSILIPQLMLAIIAVVVVCLGGLTLVSYTVFSKSEADLRQPFHLAAWGCLYADYEYTKRFFLIVPVVVQIASGVVVGSVTNDVMQLAVLIGIHAASLIAIVAVRPFTKGNVALWFTTAIGVVKVVNLSVGFAFVSKSEWSVSGRASAADIVVYLNAMLIFFWLLRHFGMLYQVVWCLRVGAAQNKYREPQLTLYTGATFFVEHDCWSSHSLRLTESGHFNVKNRASSLESYEDPRAWQQDTRINWRMNAI